jgi:hypothetical protein
MSSPASTSPNDSAVRRLAAYLRLCGLPSPQADRVGIRLNEMSVPDGAATPDVAGSLARIDAWAATLIPPEPGESDERRETRGRARLLLAGLPARAPEAFLAAEPPDDWQLALAAADVPAGPSLRQTVMSPQPLDLGPVSKVADETWRTFDKWPFLRGLTIWTLFFALLGAAFFLVRF